MRRRRGIEILVSANVSETNTIEVKYSVVVNTTQIVPIVHGTTNMENVWTYSAHQAEDKIKGVLESIQNQVENIILDLILDRFQNQVEYYTVREYAFLVAEKVSKTYKINSAGIE